MEKLFAPYETALIAQEKGFYNHYDNNETVFGWYFKRRESDRIAALDVAYVEYDQSFQQWDHNSLLGAPLYMQLLNWLRDKHNINIYVAYCEYAIESCNSWKYTFDNPYPTHRALVFSPLQQYWHGEFDNYYSALNEAIKEALKNLK